MNYTNKKFPIKNLKKIYLMIPANLSTGGPEALHQLGNILKNDLTKLFENALEEIEGRSDIVKLDVTLPADPFFVGSEHPITKISQKIQTFL